jgi:adenylate kinase family enzyme
MNKGELIPYELTVQVLINALIANPSKNYLIDGFPRARDQAVYFEQIVGEAQSVLYFNTPLDVCVDRCMVRAKTSGRADDTKETIMKRLETFKNQSQPVVEMYERFGKVREVDGSGDPIEVFNLTRKAMLPQVSWICGPKISGKTTLGNMLATRTNAKLLKFTDFVKQQGLERSDDDTVVQALIQQLALEISPRILIEDFPQNTYQAKYFCKNSLTPSRVFVLSCSKDLSQERMTQVSQSSPDYMPSALLSKSIAKYNGNLKEMLNYFRKETVLSEVSTEQNLDQSFKEVCAVVEPSVINIRSSGSEVAQGAADAVTQGLIDSGFIALKVRELVESEVERGTDVGCMIKKAGDAFADAGLVVEVLKRIIFSGIDGHNKFLLCGFPETIEQADAFEASCAAIKAIVYTSPKGSSVEIKDNNLADKNIDTLFSKEFRLKTMNEWDMATFAEHLGMRTAWGVVTGHKYQGADMIKDELKKIMDIKTINMKAIEEDLKKGKGTEDEPFEGEIQLSEVEESVVSQVNANKKCTYLFESWLHKSMNEFIAFANKNFGMPTFCIHVACDKKTTEDRWKKMNESEEIGEDAAAELDDENKKADKANNEVQAAYQACKDKVRLIAVNTDGSNEAVVENLRGNFSAKIILVNHEKHLDVDTSCANLAIKYNMLYLSVYQLIKQAVCDNTELGKQIWKTMKPKDMTEDVKVAEDAFKEVEWSAIHFDMGLVIELLRQTIANKRSSQQFILLEGMCNNRKLANDNDKLTLRYMDELFQIEKHIGEVSAVISLQNQAEASQWTDEKWEEFEEPPVAPPKQKVLNDEGEEVEEEAEAAEEEGEPKKPTWNPSIYKWTVTNRRSKNLPQLFRDFKGINVHHETKKCSEFSKDGNSAVVVKALDDFCQRVIEDHASRSLYQQVIFEEE